MVAIDINSGKSNRAKSVEETALKNNLEAAEEIAKQLRLRDLAGLIVIDFIDMEENANKLQVEKALHDAFLEDKAQIHMEKINNLGLLSLSRQRIKSSITELQFLPCQSCDGRGIVRLQEISSNALFRAIREELHRMHLKSGETIIISTAPEMIIYILNEQRSEINDQESRFNIKLYFNADSDIEADCFLVNRNNDIDKNQKTNNALSSFETKDYLKVNTQKKKRNSAPQKTQSNVKQEINTQKSGSFLKSIWNKIVN